MAKIKSTIWIFNILFFFLLCSFNKLHSQADIVYMANPFESPLNNSTDYNSIIRNIYAKEEQINEIDFYNLAACYSLLKSVDSAFYFLNKYVDTSTIFRQHCILMDTDFNFLKKQVGWNDLFSKIENNYLNEYNPKNKKLSVELWLLGLEDQRFRAYEIIQKNEPVKNEYKKNEKKTQKAFKKIIKRNGWPWYSQVGIYAGDVSFYILQHSSKKILLKNFGLLEEAMLNDEASKLNWAKAYDRCQIYQDKPQKFGTQWICTYNEADGEIIRDCYLHPLQNSQLVNQWRTEVGFTTTIEEECEKRDIRLK